MTRVRCILFAASAISIGAAVVVSMCFGLSTSQQRQVVKIDLDYKQYSDANTLKRASDLVVKGTVLDNGTFVQGAPAGVTSDGRTIPSVPQTVFLIKVNKILRGKTPIDNTIGVSLPGGSGNNTQYIIDGMPWLAKGQQAVFFLHIGNDGKYYPLAGGSGIGVQNKAGGTYTLPAAVSGSQPLSVAEPTLVNP